MHHERDFYVGYLKLPAGLARFLRKLVPSIAALAIGLAAFTARSQNDPGSGVWHDTTDELTGRIEELPYPHIRVATGDPGHPIETVLLVSEGKRGARDQIAGFVGKSARVRGTILERDGRRLLELSDERAIESAVAASASTVSDPPAPKSVALGQVTLRGEIIDPKCYCGAMKPGEGKPHKECATLCIAGGIPPMFVTLDPAGLHRYYLLTNESGRPLDARILPFVADAVEITGEMEQRDDLTLIKIDPGTTRRL